ncbi:hypothetical protein ACI6Q2_23540, partial [Chitinophagaceae bacterium LWZ2-11]
QQADSTLNKSFGFLSKINGNIYKAIDKKYDKLSNALVKSSERALKRMQRKEAKLKKKLAGKDSVLAKQLSTESVNQTYAGLNNKLQSKVDLSKKT